MKQHREPQHPRVPRDFGWESLRGQPLTFTIHTHSIFIKGLARDLGLLSASYLWNVSALDLIKKSTFLLQIKLQFTAKEKYFRFNKKHFFTLSHKYASHTFQLHDGVKFPAKSNPLSRVQRTKPWTKFHGFLSLPGRVSL